MVGRHNLDQEQLFYSFCLDEAVPAAYVFCLLGAPSSMGGSSTRREAAARSSH
jgi:hypothetical protein